MEVVKCTKIKYEALGMECVAYSTPNATHDEVSAVIKQICPTALVFGLSQTKVSKADYELLNLSKVQEFIDDVNKYENE